MQDRNNYKDSISSILNKKRSDIFLYWKGRIGLYSLLKAMGVAEGDEVILPAYTCVVVPNAIIYLGAIPIYVDVNTETYNMDISEVENAITTKTKAIICQNTYGLSTDLEILQEIANKNKIFTIEDCTHGFGGTYNDTPNGLSCDAAIYSTQWNKPFSSGIGGFTVTNNADLSSKLLELESQLTPPSSNELFKLKILYFVKRYLINKYNYWPMVNFYRWLSHNTPIVVGSSSAGEINSTTMPENYFKGFSEVQAKEGLKNIKNLPLYISKRKANALLYTEFLINLDKKHVDEKWFKNHSFLKYPLVVKDRNKFMELAEKSHIKLGEWFISPLHPVTSDLSPWYFTKGNFPTAEYLADHVVNLPTSETNIKKVLSFLGKYSNYII